MADIPRTTGGRAGGTDSDVRGEGSGVNKGVGPSARDLRLLSSLRGDFARMELNSFPIMLGARASAVAERPLVLPLSHSCEAPFVSWTAIATVLIGISSGVGVEEGETEGVVSTTVLGAMSVMALVVLFVDVLVGAVLAVSVAGVASGTWRPSTAALLTLLTVSDRETPLAREGVSVLNFAEGGGGPRGCGLGGDIT